MKARQEVLERLVVEYQRTHSASSFSGILKRVDDLILYVIHNLVRTKECLRKIEFEDIYHTAIVGVGEAVLSATSLEDGDKITARIIAYIKSNVRKTYLSTPTKNRGRLTSLEELDWVKTSLTSKETDEERREAADFVEFYLNKSNRFLSEREIEMLFVRFYQGKKYKKIGREFGVTGEAIQQRVKKILEKLQRRMKYDLRN